MKTTIIGVLTILGAALAVVQHYLQAGVITAGDMTALITAIGAGAGLIHAADSGGKAGPDAAAAGTGNLFTRELTPDEVKAATPAGFKLVAYSLPLCAALLFSSCATDTGDPARDMRGRLTNQILIEAGKVLGNAAAATLYNVAQQEMHSGKADFGDAAAAGLWASAETLISSDAVERVIDAYTGANLPKTQAAAATAYVAGRAAPLEKANAIAAVISAAAN